MGFVGNLLAALTQFARDTMDHYGAPGLFLLMALESMVVPLPSEAVMPIAGVLVRQGHMSLIAAVLASSLGSLAGSWFSYGLGDWGVKPVLMRWGKYVLVTPHRLDAAHDWLGRKGWRAIFLSRFIPGVRHVISIPAGSARMAAWPFTWATLTGATLWNGFLLWIGYWKGEEVAHALKPYLDVVGVAILVFLVAYVTYELRRGRIRHGEPDGGPDAGTRQG